MESIKKDGYLFVKTDPSSHSKYDVYKFTKEGNIKHIASFGDKRFQHYFDRVGLYSNLNHYDSDRRARYWSRHGSIRLDDGSLAINKKESPAWFSFRYLW